jgi:hypothetical protein
MLLSDAGEREGLGQVTERRHVHGVDGVRPGVPSGTLPTPSVRWANWKDALCPASSARVSPSA